MCLCNITNTQPKIYGDAADGTLKVFSCSRIIVTREHMSREEVSLDMAHLFAHVLI